MKTSSILGRRFVSLFAGTLLGIVSAQSSPGQYIFFDHFDSESVGSFPSTWTNIVSPPGGQIYVTNGVGAPSSPNAFQIGNAVANQDYTVRRDFPQYSLNTTSQLVVNYSLNVSLIPSDGFSGFAIVPGNLPSQGEETFAAIRVYKGTLAGTWLVQDFYDGLVTNNLPLNTWHNFRFEIDPSSTNAQNGVVRWYIDNNLMHTENFVVPSILRTNINSLNVRNLFLGSSPPTTFYLDNVYVFAEIPEPSALMLTAAGVGLVALRTRRK